MKIIISTYSELPIYSQIKEQIKEQILSGEVREGTTLPSIRELAKELGVSVITTTRAYNDLEREGFIKARQGLGCIVLAKDNKRIKEQCHLQMVQSFERVYAIATQARMNKEELKKLFEEYLDTK